MLASAVSKAFRLECDCGENTSTRRRQDDAQCGSGAYKAACTARALADGEDFGRPRSLRHRVPQVVLEGDLYGLTRDAKDRLSDFEERLQQPLVSSSPSGEWSDYEQIKLEFSTKLRAKVSSAKLGQWTAYNNSARQILAAEVKTVPAFAGGVASARLPGERCDGDFVLLLLRYELVPEYRILLDAKLEHWRMQHRQRHAALSRVKALPPGASLLEIFIAVTSARGRPQAADGNPSTKAPQHEKKITYEKGAFAAGWLPGFTDFANSSVGAPLKTLKGKILGSNPCITKNYCNHVEIRHFS